MNCKFNHITIKGIKTLIPERYIDIDDEIEYFENNPKKLARAKKMIGYGRRYIADEGVSVVDMCVECAEKLFDEMGYDRNKIDLLVFVNQKPDFREPADACIAHGKLRLNENCASFDILLGCSGYPHGLFMASSMIESKVAQCALILVGDIASYGIRKDNRKSVQLFGDACSATIIEYTKEHSPIAFSLGTRGKDWETIITPMGGIKIAPKKEDFDLIFDDGTGNKWNPMQPLMQGEDVFRFSIEIAPKIIQNVLDIMNYNDGNIDYYIIHQANKQIVESIAMAGGLPIHKVPTETFTKYANNSTNSVVTVMCDVLKDKNVSNIVICTFGIGLSWGSILCNISSTYNGGIETYAPKTKYTREEMISKYVTIFSRGGGGANC